MLNPHAVDAWPEAYLEREKDHLDDFAPELAMVTKFGDKDIDCLLYTSPSPRDGLLSRMPSSA